MKKFLILYRSTVSAKDQMAKASPEQAKAGMEMWMKWAAKAGPAIVDLGAPLSPIGSADENLGGYSILQAESAQALDVLLKDHPHRMAPGASIIAHEMLSMPGM